MKKQRCLLSSKLLFASLFTFHALAGCHPSLLHVPQAEEDAGHELAFVGEADALFEQLRPTADGWWVAPELSQREPFHRIALRLDAAAAIQMEARFSQNQGEQSPWLPLVFTFQEGIALNAHANAPFLAHRAQIRFRAPMEADLRFAAM